MRQRWVKQRGKGTTERDRQTEREWNTETERQKQRNTCRQRQQERDRGTKRQRERHVSLYVGVFRHRREIYTWKQRTIQRKIHTKRQTRQ